MASTPQHLHTYPREDVGMAGAWARSSIASQGRHRPASTAELASPFTALGQPLGVQTFQQTTGRW